MCSETLSNEKKKEIVSHILNNSEVRVMFKNITPKKLPVTFKLKVVTFLLKHRLNI